MISSTVKDLLLDRQATITSLKRSRLVNFLGVKPIDTNSQSGSSYIATIKMAEECDLYILILGGKYGYTPNDNKSATELEFDAAYRKDPTKILIFKKQVARTDALQKAFIEKVSEYNKGYFISRYKMPDQLSDISFNSFSQWISERSALGTQLNYFDHFIRLAIQRTPFPQVYPSYYVAENHLELKYKIAGRILSIHFEKHYIYSDFWGSVAKLDEYFEKWRNAKYETT